jgi:hypothetical protein
MPPNKSRRVARCEYSENGVRCRRSGTGDPPLCNPHRIVAQDAGRPPEFGDGIKNLFDRFVEGKRINPKHWRGALKDTMAYINQAAAAQANGQPPPPPPGGFRPPPGFRAPPGWPFQGFPGSPPPPPDPTIAERARARKLLGFAHDQPITLDMLQKRRRELARQHHPDRGGSVTKMQAVNAACDVLEAQLKESA